MQEKVCELRFDIPLAAYSTPQQFEQCWRAVLAGQRLTVLALPPAEAMEARFRICGTAADDQLRRYLPLRLGALPGAPQVAAEPADADTDWQGIKIWLSYRAQDLPALLHRAKRKPALFSTSRGRS